MVLEDACDIMDERTGALLMELTQKKKKKKMDQKNKETKPCMTEMTAIHASAPTFQVRITACGLLAPSDICDHIRSLHDFAISGESLDLAVYCSNENVT